jgi:hypothetical protein
MLLGAPGKMPPKIRMATLTALQDIEEEANDNKSCGEVDCFHRIINGGT